MFKKMLTVGPLIALTFGAAVLLYRFLPAQESPAFGRYEIEYLNSTGDGRLLAEEWVGDNGAVSMRREITYPRPGRPRIIRTLDAYDEALHITVNEIVGVVTATRIPGGLTRAALRKSDYDPGRSCVVTLDGRRDSRKHVAGEDTVLGHRTAVIESESDGIKVREWRSLDRACLVLRLETWSGEKLLSRKEAQAIRDTVTREYYLVPDDFERLDATSYLNWCYRSDGFSEAEAARLAEERTPPPIVMLASFEIPEALRLGCCGGWR